MESDCTQSGSLVLSTPDAYAEGEKELDTGQLLGILLHLVPKPNPKAVHISMPSQKNLEENQKQTFEGVCPSEGSVCVYPGAFQVLCHVNSLQSAHQDTNSVLLRQV